jgi:tRNA wybutosine-synthesizing protein 2
MKAVRVPKLEAEKVRRFAEKVGAKDKGRLIVAKGDYVEIPIYDGYEHLFEGYEIIEQENPIFAKKMDLFEILKDKIPKEMWEFIPRRYKIVGDIILIKIADELEDYKHLIGQELLKIHPRCKAVWRDRGKEGMLRKPNVELIAGEGSMAVHKENGCLFKLDVTKVMFSVGNQGERMRMAKIVKDGEVVVDMFAGIGYFSIPIAVHSKPKRIYSIEINPDSYGFLLENIKLNKVDCIVPILGDSMYVTPEGMADRVVMGHIYCHEFLPTAIRALKDEGGIIHYHESVPEVVLDRPVERIKRACKELGKNVKILNFRKVKNYSPGVLHVVVDAYIY